MSPAAKKKSAGLGGSGSGSGVFERFPGLRYIITESGCAWVPATLRQLDRIHMGFKAGAIGEMTPPIGRLGIPLL